MLMYFMINIAKEKKIKEDPNEDDVNRMYKQICGDIILSLNNNPRSESYLWHSLVRYKSKKREKKESETYY